MWQATLPEAYWRKWMTPDEARSLLGLGAMATADEIKQAVRRLRVRFHPDRHVGAPPDLVTLAQREFDSARQAEEVLLASGRQTEESASTDNDATFNLGRELLESKDDADHSRAFQLLLKAANGGHANAQTWTGYCLERGIGTTMNSAAAMQWYLAAAMAGNVNAQFAVGIQYMEGRGAPKDEGTAIQWIEKAACNGSKHAQHFMGDYHERQWTGRDLGKGLSAEELSQLEDHRAWSLHWYRLAAEEGVAEAQFQLAAHIAGDQNVEKWTWLVKAANSGHPRAQAIVGAAFSEFDAGSWRRATTDYVIAREYLESATAHGDAGAAFHLALLCETGSGGQVDVSRAVKLYERSILDGGYHSSLARARLALLHRAGWGVRKDRRRAKTLAGAATHELFNVVRHHKLACKFGLLSPSMSGEALFLLGMLHAHGLGVSKDRSKAREYLRGALGLGHPQAEAELESKGRWWKVISRT
jgi:uncharacterized protein